MDLLLALTDDETKPHIYIYIYIYACMVENLNIYNTYMDMIYILSLIN